jgi:hypothetical protein
VSWSFVQSASSFGTQRGFEAVAYGSNVSSGNKLVVWTTVKLTTTSTVKDGAGNSWTKLASIGLNGSTANGEFALWALDCPAGDAGTAPTITATFAGSQFGGLLVEEVSGLLAGNTSAMLDGTAGTTSGTLSAGGNAGPPSYSSTASNEWLAYGYGDNAGSSNVPSWTAPAGYTPDANGVNGAGVVNIANAYKNSTGTTETGHYTITLAGGTALWGEIMVAFKLAAGGAAPSGTVQPRATVTARSRRRARAAVQSVLGLLNAHGPSGTVQPRATVPVPRRKPARAIVQHVTGPANAHGPSGQIQPPDAVPVPRRRKLTRAYIQFTPVTTANAVPVITPSGTVQPRATVPARSRRPARALILFTRPAPPLVPSGTIQSRATLVTTRRKPSRALIPVPLAPFVPLATEGGAVYYPYHHRGRGRTR